MLYLDMDKNNLSHKEIDLSSKKQDIKFIAEAKNIKEKYNDMTVVLLTSDKIMKITASTFDVKAKNLEEFLEEYLKVDINGLYELAEKYDYTMAYGIIYKTLLENKDIDGLYELAKNSNLSHLNWKETFYKAIFQILSDNKDMDGLYELTKNSNLCHSDKESIYKVISNILSDIKDIGRLYELKERYRGVPGAKQLRKIISIKIGELENNK